MTKCEVCGAIAGAPVRLPAGDYVTRQLYQCPTCKTIICNACMREEHIHKPRGFFTRILSALKDEAEMYIAQAHCSICNASLDLSETAVA
jgi:hypothetical protein